MGTTWKHRLQLAAGVLLVLVALWLVLGNATGDGEGGAAGSSTTASSSSRSATSSVATPSSTRRSTPSSTGRTTPSSPTGERTPDSGLPTIAASELPREGRETLRLIHRGGPFPYDRDGITFQNRERMLPAQPRGYYAEYTVPTPGESDRGARRLVAGDDGDVYFTDDHYRSFRQVEEDR